MVIIIFDGRVAALQYAVLFAPLKRTFYRDEEYTSEVRTRIRVESLEMQVRRKISRKRRSFLVS